MHRCASIDVFLYILYSLYFLILIAFLLLSLSVFCTSVCPSSGLPSYATPGPFSKEAFPPRDVSDVLISLAQRVAAGNQIARQKRRQKDALANKLVANYISRFHFRG